MPTTWMFTQRRRAKDATLSLLRLNEEGDIDVKVYVKGQEEYYIEVDYPDWLQDSINGALSLGVKTGDEVNADECIEFYQGEALSRFRGV